MDRKDYEEVALALASAAARLDEERKPGGSLESLAPDHLRRVLAIVSGGMAERFADHNPYRFNAEAFLSACGTLDDVRALTPHTTGPRNRYEPIEFADVKLGDCLYYVTGGGGHCAGIVTSITDLTVAFDHAWDLERSVDLYTVKLRRANWSRHHVVLMDPIDLPSAPGSPQPNAAGLAAQEFPGPARPSGAPVAGTADPVRYPQSPSNRARRRSR